MATAGSKVHPWAGHPGAWAHGGYFNGGYGYPGGYGNFGAWAGHPGTLGYGNPYGGFNFRMPFTGNYPQVRNSKALYRKNGGELSPEKTPEPVDPIYQYFDPISVCM